MSPEWRFIAACCRHDRAPFAAGKLDWHAVTLGVDRHGLARLVPQMLAGQGLIPADVAARLRRMEVEQAAVSLAQLGEALRICALLDEAGIRFLLIKGLALSIQLYGRPGVRASKDIDLIIEPGAGTRVDAILSSLGYVRPEEDRKKDDLSGFVAKEVGYLHHQRGMMVEVHSRLTENADLYDAHFEDLWASRETVVAGGRSIPTMARALLATYLCVHGARHCWARLMWLLDIAALTTTPGEIEAALADARRRQLEPVVLHALWMLHRWFGHEVPVDILARARAHRSVRVLNRMTSLFHADRRWYMHAPRNSWRRFYQYSLLGRVASYSMKPGRAYWRKQLALDLISPADRMIVSLPPQLDWVYILLRPFGWLIRRIRG